MTHSHSWVWISRTDGWFDILGKKLCSLQMHLYTYVVFCFSEILNVCLDGIVPTQKPAQKSSNGRLDSNCWHHPVIYIAGTLYSVPALHIGTTYLFTPNCIHWSLCAKPGTFYSEGRNALFKNASFKLRHPPTRSVFLWGYVFWCDQWKMHSNDNDRAVQRYGLFIVRSLV